MTDRGKLRTGFFLVFLACVGLLGYAHYVQYVEYIEPCPLCIFQRLGFYAMGIVSLVAAIHGPRRTSALVYGGLAVIAGVAGGSVSVRHVWLQMQPQDSTASCGAGLNYMLDTMGWTDAIASAFRGTGSCAEVDWSFLGLSMPAWTLMCFIGLVAWVGFVVWRWRG